MAARAAGLLASVLVVACASSPSEILVVVDTDLHVPGQVDAIHLVVTGPAGRMQTADSDLTAGDMHLPRTTTLIHDTGPLGPFLVHAVATASGAQVVDRTARVSFVEGRVVVLRIDLLASCVGVGCGADMTCATGGCRAIDVAASELGAWQGSVPPHLDAGVSDGATPDACNPSTPEVCNGVDDNCDGRIDETTDLRSDPTNCGGCGHVCTAVPNATAACVLGACQIVCDATHADCDGLYGNGCEQSLDVVSSCGGCGTTCAIAHATPTCATGTCAPASCVPGWDSCDRMTGVPDLNGCETNVDANPAVCGSCTMVCPTPPHATPTCAGGSCGFACDSGWADCIAAPGCESSLSDAATCGDCATRCTGATPYCSGDSLHVYSCVADCTPPLVRCGSSCVDTTQSPQNCSTCGMVCPSLPHSAPTCVGSTCGFACDSGYGDCDGMAPTGCEVSLLAVATCGSCTSPCAPMHATGTCGGGACAIGSCEAGWADCNGLVDDGCEVHVAVDVGHCGSCTTVCPTSPTHATSVCGSSGCDIQCDPGFGDCDGMAVTGCEADLGSSANCGACGTGCASPFVCQTGGSGASCVLGCGGVGDPTHMLCGGACVDVTMDLANCTNCGAVCPSLPHATPTCSATGCGFACAAGFADCDTMASTGCETDTTATATACGSCTNPCPAGLNATPLCTASTCGLRCSAGFADCNTMMPGCETMLGTVANCRSCGDMCSMGSHVASAACGATGCTQVCRAGYWDCDGSFANGCELRDASAADACVACGAACTSGQICCGRACMTGTSCP